jgi:hypothetical protein
MVHLSNSTDPAPQKSWWGRNWIWVLPVGCLMPLLLCCGGILSFGLFLFSTLKSTDAYKDAVARATSNAEVKKLLGEPLTVGFWTVGNVQIENAAGNADLMIPISGPKGSAIIHAVATKSEGKWNFSKLELDGAKGSDSVIDLLPSAEKPDLKSAPKASP